jgi:hypothetical protein
MNSNLSLGTVFGLILDWLQLHAGTSIAYLEAKSLNTYVQKNWFTPIQEFLMKIEGTITTKGRWTPPLLRQNDLVIMDEVNKLKITPTNIKTENNWRLYFNVNTVEI